MKYDSVISNYSSTIEKIEAPFVIFDKDEFIRNYITSLNLLQQQSVQLPELIELKFQELMLHLLSKDPHSVLAFKLRNQHHNADIEIQKAVEQNLTNNLTVEELAFLCNTSVSSFKRRFLKLYNTTPSQYILQRKMELAASYLLQHESPGEIFFKVGYENHSSFSQSFKQVFGMSPKEFQQQQKLKTVTANIKA